MDEPASTTKSVLNALQMLLGGRKDRGGACCEWDSGFDINLPRTPSGSPLGGHENAVEFSKSKVSFSDPKIPESDLFSPARFRKFANTTGLSFSNTMDLRVIFSEARDCGKYYQRPSKQAARIAIPVLGKRWPNLGL